MRSTTAMRTSVGALVAIAALAALAAPVAADRFPPRTTRDAVLGCWQVGDGATLVLTAFGKHSVRYTTRFDRTVRGRQRPAGLATWVAADGELEVSCRPDSQHGSFCRIAPTTSGLRVRVFVIHHDDPTTGHLATELIATRCSK